MGTMRPIAARSTYSRWLGPASGKRSEDLTSLLTDGVRDLRCIVHRYVPRKEVIQPHLPVRLPCYDFTPITEPTFDGSLPCGLGHRLRVFPAFVV
jgi:hypothetical protein